MGDEYVATWSEFFSTVKRHYPRFRLTKVAMALALLDMQSMSLLSSRRSRPFHTGRGKGANVNLEVADGLLWDELGIKPEYLTIHEGIPAVLDDYVAFRWLHPLSDRR